MVEVIDAASRNVTTVMVAHKLQTVVDADLILVMQDGLLVEQGTHTSLLCQANSTYARMWAEQASGFDGAARGEDGVPVDYCKLALEDQRVPYVPWSAAPPARSKLPLCAWRARGHPPPQRPARLARAARFLGPRGEPSPLGGRRAAAVALVAVPTHGGRVHCPWNTQADPEDALWRGDYPRPADQHLDQGGYEAGGWLW